MAAADTARLVAELTLDARGFQRGVATAGKSLGKLEGTVSNIGKRAQQGVGTLGKNLALIGVGAAGAIALAVKGGLDDLSTLNSAIVSVDGAIASVGATGQITGRQVAEWANQIEADIGAAFDDKDITAAAATLLRFGKTAPKNLRPALQVVTDLAVKTGDVESAASLLAKALADPTKAAGKLARSGVILTKAQQKTIDAMVKQNDIAGAQKVILDALAATTSGAAANSQDKYRRSISLLNDVAEDAKKALAEGFLPVIQRVADLLSKKLQDPRFLQGIRDFGNTLAGGLDDLVSIAERLPWGAIGDSLKIAGAGAKAVLNAFVSLPPWVQTAVLTGWGLNKLTGGALSGIVGELAKGLVKGVLGINAGVVNINAATVTGAGGVPGAPGAKPGATGLTGIVKDGLEAGFKLAIPAIVGGVVGGVVAHTVAGAIDPRLQQSIDNGAQPLANRDPRRFNQNGQVVANLSADVKQNIAGTKSNTEKLIGVYKGGIGDAAKLANVANERLEAIKTQQVAAATALGSKIKDGTSETKGALGKTTQEIAASAAKTYAGQQAGKAATVQAQQSAAASIKAAQDRTTAAAQASAAAIRAKKLSVNVENHNIVSTTVSVRETIKGQTTFKSYYKTQS